MSWVVRKFVIQLVLFLRGTFEIFFLNNFVSTNKILSFGGYVQIRTSDYASVTNQVSNVVRRQF